jgi:hypothetical protein
MDRWLIQIKVDGKWAPLRGAIHGTQLWVVGKTEREAREEVPYYFGAMLTGKEWRVIGPYNS